jgi:hypothetical protein
VGGRESGCEKPGRETGLFCWGVVGERVKRGMLQGVTAFSDYGRFSALQQTTDCTDVDN